MLAVLYGLVVGLSLGLTGGGGSIFAVPLLVYGLGEDFRSAVALSLAVVGLTAAYGAILQARRGQVLWGAGVVLGLGGVVAAPFGAMIGRHLPEQVSLIAFAGLMIVIGIRMLRARRPEGDGVESWFRCRTGRDGRPQFSLSCAGKLLVAGAATGVLSGAFGVGGGFLVVPALLLVACSGIESALATSLVGIALIAASGFVANIGNVSRESLPVAALFLGGALIGVTFGAWLKTRIPAAALSRVFGVSVLGVAGYIVVRAI